MSARIVSFFTEEVICMHCLQHEREVLSDLKDRGLDLTRFAGCGYVPVPAALPVDKAS